MKGIVEYEPIAPEPEEVESYRYHKIMLAPCRIVPDDTGNEPDGCRQHSGAAFGSICEAKLAYTREASQ